MMAWILVSLLAGYASGAVVDLSPETTVAPPDGGNGFPDNPPKP